MCSCSGPTSPLATFMQAYSGTPAAQDKARDKNHDGMVEPYERVQRQPVAASKAPGTGAIVDITT